VVLQGASKDHRIVVVCDSCNSARDAINRFLSLRSLVGYEIFSLPGGPGKIHLYLFWFFWFFNSFYDLQTGSLLMEEADIR